MPAVNVALVVLLAISPTAPGLAQEEQMPPAAAPARIETTATAGSDRAIERRLRGIFDEVEGLSDVRIRVSDGVVELSGEALYADQHERAVRLAGQVQGVVEVEDKIAEVRDIGRRLAPVVDRLVDRGWQLVSLLPLLGIAAVIVLVFWSLGWLIGRWDGLFRRVARNPFLADVLRQVVRGAVFVGGVIIALDVLDATTLVGTVLGAAGILGLALGFALRDTVENYIASLLLSLRQPFRRDDLVLIEGWEGLVLRLTSRATVLMTLDGNHVRIPNAVVYKSIVVNFTRNPARRFQFDVGVGVEQDLAAVQKLGAQTLQRMGGVLDDPPPMATVEALGDSSVLIRLYGWVDQSRADFLKVRSEAIRLVKQAFDDAAISMPEPIYNVRMSGDPTIQSAAPSRERGPSEAIDIAPQDHLEQQIESERHAYGEEDLLAADAPKE